MSDEDAISEADELLRRGWWRRAVQQQLPDICSEVNALCTMGHTYSLRYVAQRFTSAQSVQGILAAADSADSWASILAQLLRACETVDLNQQLVEIVFKMLAAVVSGLHRNGIEPFVRLVREEGHAEAAVLDGYGDFRRRWLKLIEQAETLAKNVGLRLDSSAYLAPELHVTLKS